jgi:DNA polymerase (family 10)
MQELRYAGVVPAVLTPVGSLRRFSPDVGDVAIFAAAATPQREQLLRAFTTVPSVQRVAALAPAGATIVTGRGSVTLHVGDPATAGAALVWLTGSLRHVRALVDLAASRGLHFAGGSLTDASGRELPCESEEQLYATMGLPFIAPELREGADEIEAAHSGRLPQLLTQSEIRGDLHMHSLWSDGRDTIETMVRSAASLRYEYVAITDHSQRAWSSRKLALEDIDDQRAEIEFVRRQYPAVRILHGIEVDIMKDATLDFDDEVLARFDIVLASLHDHGGQDGAELTARYLSAIRHPLVNVITHPMGRSPAVSDGYDLDLPRIFEEAVRTGTAMEVDGAPGHLDMDGTVARQASAAGVTIVVDSDCHRSEALRRQMRFGVGTARRGWLEARHVLNTRPVDDVLAFVSQKRARG